MNAQDKDRTQYLRQAEAEYDRFKAKLRSLKIDGQQKLDKGLDEVRTRWDALERRWQELRSEGKARFEHSRVEFERAQDDLRRSFDALKSKAK